MNMNSVLENLRFGSGCARQREYKGISRLLEFSGETPDGEGRPWFVGGKHAGL
jgi:hypothetical protein